RKLQAFIRATELALRGRGFVAGAECGCGAEFTIPVTDGDRRSGFGHFGPSVRARRILLAIVAGNGEDTETRRADFSDCAFARAGTQVPGGLLAVLPGRLPRAGKVRRVGFDR